MALFRLLHASALHLSQVPFWAEIGANATTGCPAGSGKDESFGGFFTVREGQVALSGGRTRHGLIPCNRGGLQSLSGLSTSPPSRQTACSRYSIPLCSPRPRNKRAYRPSFAGTPTKARLTPCRARRPYSLAAQQLRLTSHTTTFRCWKSRCPTTARAHRPSASPGIGMTWVQAIFSPADCCPHTMILDREAPLPSEVAPQRLVAGYLHRAEEIARTLRDSRALTRIHLLCVTGAARSLDKRGAAVRRLS